MAEGRDRQQWNHTSALIASIVNANPYRKGKAARAEQFHPYLRREGAQAKGMRLTKHTLKFLALAMGATGIEKEPPQ